MRDRFYAAYDGGVPVGTAADFPFTLTVPGGELRGRRRHLGRACCRATGGTAILTQLMRRELDDVRERGEPLAILWASEAAIYGRFGYGIAAPHYEMDADRARFAFRDDPGAAGQGADRLRSRTRSSRACRCTTPCVRPTPGFTARSREWWEAYRLADPEEWRRGASPKYVALVELDGEPAAYAIYRIKSEWQDGFPKSEVRVVEALAARPAAERELWRFVFGIDLIDARRKSCRPGIAALPDGRRCAQPATCVQVRGPLAADRRRRGRACRPFVSRRTTRSCSTCATTSVRGTPDAGASAGRSPRTDDDAELELDVADLASVYLGGVRLHPPRRGRARARAEGRGARARGRAVPHAAPAVLSRGLLMAFDVRTVKDLDEFTRAVFAIGQYFGMVAERGAHAALHRPAPARAHARGVVERARSSAAQGSFTFNLTVPGGDLPTAGVTVVGVLPDAPAARRAALADARAARRRARARGAARRAVGVGGVDLRPLRLRARLVLRRDHARARVHRVRASVRA